MYPLCNVKYYGKQQAVKNERYSIEAFNEWEKGNCKDCKYHYGLCTKGDILLEKVRKKIVEKGE